MEQLSKQCKTLWKDDVYPVEMFPEFFRHLAPFPLLNVKHDPESFPGLVRPELVDEVMHVDEQQVEVLNLLFPPGGIWRLDEEVDQVQEVYQDLDKWGNVLSSW